MKVYKVSGCIITEYEAEKITDNSVLIAGEKNYRRRHTLYEDFIDNRKEAVELAVEKCNRNITYCKHEIEQAQKAIELNSKILATLTQELMEV